MSDQVKVIGAAVLLVVAVVVMSWQLFGDRGNARHWDSDDASQRLLAVEALRADDSASARQRLSVMLNDADRRVVVQAVRALADNRSEANHRVLLEQLSAAEDPKVVGEVAAALGEYEQTSTNTLTALLNNPQPDVRAGAARGLAAKKDRAAIPELYKALTDPDPKVRSWAITGISKVIIWRFVYEAEKPPQQQMDRIRYIGDFLRRNGYM